MSIQKGDSIPSLTLRRFTADGMQEVTTDSIFSGRKVVLFGLPGAYTPTCQNDHLPSFLEQHDAMREKGVDEIVCIAVNDPFVMAQWNKDTGSEGKITMLSDGNGEFAGATELAFDGSGVSLGTRSKRYAALVEDGKVTAIEIEENPGVCTVSNASTIIEALS